MHMYSFCIFDVAAVRPRLHSTDWLVLTEDEHKTSFSYWSGKGNLSKSKDALNVKIPYIK